MRRDVRDHLPLAAYMELIHVATLIHDDVVDDADTRRGVNATAVDFGNRVSVLAGDYLFAWIFKNVTATYAHPIPHILSATLADITDGEVLQLRSLGNLDLHGRRVRRDRREEDRALVRRVGRMRRDLPADSGAGVRALREFGIHYGIAFQMQDDLLDMTSNEARSASPSATTCASAR